MLEPSLVLQSAQSTMPRVLTVAELQFKMNSIDLKLSRIFHELWDLPNPCPEVDRLMRIKNKLLRKRHNLNRRFISARRQREQAASAARDLQ